MELKYVTAKGALSLVRSMDFEDVFRGLGITPEEFKLLVGPAQWLGTDRNGVRKSLDACMAGGMDLAGVPRFEMPAEYIAAVIRAFVSPNNIHKACAWMENQRPAEAIAGASSSPETVSPAQLFALCNRLIEGDDIAVQQSFEKRVGIAIHRSVDPEKGKKNA
mgnify:CR=1 FL=1